MTCFRCGDDQNLIRDDERATGAICVWCLQHRAELDEEWGEDNATLAVERGPR